MSKILITGTTGLIGAALSKEWAEQMQIIAPVRYYAPGLPDTIEQILIPNIVTADWTNILSGVEAVVHCAARVHIMNDEALDPISEFRSVNVDATVNLAKAAVANGVKRFIFISSIKVNGEETEQGRPFHAHDKPNPQDAYGISKFEAEEQLKACTLNSGMELIIVRLPMVYGQNSKGNFALLAKLVRTGLPLPLASIKNGRNFIFLGNVVDVLTLCVTRPLFSNETILVSDAESVSTPVLIRKIATATGKKAHLFPMPPKLLRLVAKFTGQRAVIQRLTGSLELDIEHGKQILQWNPRFSLDEGLRLTLND